MVKLRGLLAVAMAAAATGCSILPGSGLQDIRVETSGTTEAKCELVNAKGTWYVPTTPVLISIIPDTSPLIVTCTKDGFEDGQTTIDPAGPEEEEEMSTTRMILGGFLVQGFNSLMEDSGEYPPLIIVDMVEQSGGQRSARDSLADQPGGSTFTDQGAGGAADIAADAAYDALVANDYVAAEQELQKILAIKPKDEFALYNMAIVYEKTGRIDQARSAYATVIATASPNVVAGSSEGERPLVEFAQANLVRLNETSPPPPEVTPPLGGAPDQMASAPPRRTFQPSSGETSGAFSGLGIHLASFRKRSNADKAWIDLLRKHSDILSDLVPRVVRVDLDEKGIFHRLIAGPIFSREEGKEMCRSFKRRDQYCRVIKAE